MTEREVKSTEMPEKETDRQTEKEREREKEKQWIKEGKLYKMGDEGV